MRLQLLVLAAALAGVVAGAWLIAMWAVGCAIIFDSLMLGAFALLWDRPTAAERDELTPRRLSVAQGWDVRRRAS